jgi:anti-anti-sigma regulatory factor
MTKRSAPSAVLGKQSVVSVTLDQTEELCFIHLEGEISITSATELKRLLIEALASGRELRVDLERATELDLTALQLLWAAERAAGGSGTGFMLVGSVPEGIAVALGDAGFEKFPIPIETK